MSTNVVVSNAAHMMSMVHAAAATAASASIWNGLMIAAAAASPVPQTTPTTGRVHTPMSHRLPDVPEEVHEGDRTATQDGGAEGDEHPTLSAASEVRVGGVGAHRPHDRRDNQREDGEDQTHGH